MWLNLPSLQESLADAPLDEFRQPQGKRYELQPILTLSCVALMCGAQSEQEIAEWAGGQGRRWMKWLGIKNEKGPSAITIARIFRGIDGARLKAAVLQWSQLVLDSLQLSEDDDEWDESLFESEDPWIATKRWAEGGEFLPELGRHLKSFLDRLAACPLEENGEERKEEIRARESLLVGLVLTGYVETRDLRLEKPEKPKRKDKKNACWKEYEEVNVAYVPIATFPQHRTQLAIV